MKAFKFQETAVQDMVREFNKLSTLPTTKDSLVRTLTLQAPCGFGKTVMLSKFISQASKNAVTIVTSPSAGGLEKQTYESIATNLPDRKVILLDGTTPIGPMSAGDVIVGNYNIFISRHNRNHVMGGQNKSKSMRDGDSLGFFSRLEEASQAGIEVHLVIDEAHYGNSNTAKQTVRFFEEITKVVGYAPIRVKATATPTEVVIDSRVNRMVSVQFEDGLSEGLVRQGIQLNHGLSAANKLSGATTTEEQLMWEMYNQWLRLCDLKDSDAPTPMMMFCVADGIAGDRQQAMVEKFLADKCVDPATNRVISVDSGTLAIHTSKQHENVNVGQDYKSPSSPVVAVIFKRAIALGWDCPRAQLMCVFRDMVGPIFKIQTMGRLMRQPNAKPQVNPEMNYAYVYADVGTGFTLPAELKPYVTDLEYEALDADHDLLEYVDKVGPIYTSYAKRTERNRGIKTLELHKRFARHTIPAGVWDPKPTLSNSEVLSDSLVTFDNPSAMVMSTAEGTQSFQSENGSKKVFLSKLSRWLRNANVNITTDTRTGEQVVNALRMWLLNNNAIWGEAEYSTWLTNAEVVDPVVREVIESYVAPNYNDGESNTRTDGDNYNPPAAVLVPKSRETWSGRGEDGTRYFRKYTNKLAKSHLYGEWSAHKVTPTEEEFEDTVLSHTPPIMVWWRNDTASISNGPANASKFRMAFEGPKSYGTMYPDYFSVVRKGGKYLGVAIEVKAHGFTDLAADDARFYKAEHCYNYSRGNVRACVVYPAGPKDDTTWMVVKGRKLNGGIDEIAWEEWLDQLT